MMRNLGCVLALSVFLVAGWGRVAASGTSAGTEPTPNTVIDAISRPDRQEQNKEVVRRLLMDCFSGGHIEILDEVLSPDFEFEYPNLPPGIDGLKAIVKKNNESFEGWQFAMHDVLAVEDKVVVRWSASGIHVKSFLGEPPTNKEVRLKGIAIYLLREGRILKDWVEPDNLGFLTQLGILGPIDLTADEK